MVVIEKSTVLFVPVTCHRSSAVDGPTSPQINQSVNERPPSSTQHPYVQTSQQHPNFSSSVSIRRDLLFKLLTKTQKPKANKPPVLARSPSYSDVCVMEQICRNPYLYTFREVCSILDEHLDYKVDECADFIRDTFLNYSLNIYNLPECPEEDLLLAVYLFIEDTFGISCKINLCVRYTVYDAEEDMDDLVVGVVLDSIKVKRTILKKATSMELPSDIVVLSNEDIDWILDGFCPPDKDPGVAEA